MHRPTRKHTHLTQKLERKKAHSRVSGKKARRWRKALDKYLALNQASG